MNTRNVQNGPGLVIVQQIQISCFSIAANLVEHVDSNPAEGEWPALDGSWLDSHKEVRPGSVLGSASHKGWP